VEAETVFLEATANHPALAHTECAIRCFAAKSEFEIRDVLLPILNDAFSIHLSPFALSAEPGLYRAALGLLEGRLREILLGAPPSERTGVPPAVLVERLMREIGS